MTVLNPADGSGQPTSWTRGEDVGVFAPVQSPARALMRDGTTIAPETGVRPTFMKSRKESITLAALEEVSGPGADGADVLALDRNVVEGLATAETQAVASYNAALQRSKVIGKNPDAVGSYNLGLISGSAPSGSGIGIVAIGRREGEAVGDVSGAEIYSHNRTVDGVYSSAGASDTKALWLVGAGTKVSAVAAQVGNPFGMPFKVGFGVNGQNGGAATEAAFRDDSEAAISLDIRGKHATAAVRVKRLGGSVVIGRDTLATASALLEVVDDELSHTPIAVFGSTTGAKNYSVLTRNSAGALRTFVAGEAGFEFAGTAIGDSGLAFTAGKGMWIGAVGKEPKIRVTEGGLSFYGVAPVARHAAIAEPAETLAGLKAAVNGLRDAISKIGITE